MTARRQRRKGRANTLPDRRVDRTQALVRAIGAGGDSGGIITVAVTEAVQALIGSFESKLVEMQSQIDELIIQAKINNKHNEVTTEVEFTEHSIEHEETT